MKEISETKKKKKLIFKKQKIKIFFSLLINKII